MIYDNAHIYIIIYIMIALYSIYSTTTQELIINQQGCQLLSVSVIADEGVAIGTFHRCGP
jgi:hypothetical protein